jgi:polysaccharide biosynthesis protein PslG
VLLALGMIGLIVTAAAARPAAAMPGPSSIATGLVDDTTFESQTASLRATWLTRAEQLGSSWVRVAVPWFVVAPASPGDGFRATDAADPHYRWGFLDDAIRDATSRRQHILLMVTEAPSWALGQHPSSPSFAPVWQPSPTAFGQFAHALAQRYSGHFADPVRPGRKLPNVSYFQAWNEPNLRTALMPQWTRSHGRWVSASPSWYRGMLNAFYAGVKSVQRHARVLAAGLAPYGDPPGVDRTPPVVFLREMLCLSGPRLRRERCPNPAHFDAIDEHPYALTPTIPARNSTDVSVPDFGKLRRVLTAARRAHRALPSGSKQIWMTELDWTSKPPDPYGVALSLQARYVSLAFYELWRQGVSHMFWFLIRDLPYKSLTGAGLYFRNGVAKPSTTAFRFPFVAIPAAHQTGRVRTLILWGRAPKPGRVTIQLRRGHAWRTVLRLSTTRGGVFYAQRRFAAHSVLRAQEGKLASLGFSS